MRYILVLLLLFPAFIYSQNNLDSRNNVAIGVGFSRTALTDEYVSPNEYAGTATYSGFNWGHQTSKRLVQFDIALNRNHNLKNHLSRAKYGYFLLHYRQLYFLMDSSLASDRLSFYIGPGLTVFYMDREQKYVPINSSFGAGSIDFNTRIQATLSRKFSFASQLLLSVVSYANKTKSSSMEQSVPGFQLLTLLTFPNLEFDLSGRFNFSKLFYTQLVYSLSYQTTSKWDRYTRIEDRLYLQLGIRF